MTSLAGDATEYELEDDQDELEVMSRAQADFFYWGNMPFWTLDEGIALLLGKDPSIVKWDVVRHYVNYFESSELCLDYDKLRTLVLRAVEIGEIDEPTFPVVFLEWAKNSGIEISEVLWQQVEKRKSTVINCSDENDRSHFDSTENLAELESLLKIKEKEIDSLKEELDFVKKRVMDLEGLKWDGFDDNVDTYSKELAIAVKAHGVISKNWKKGSSIKKQIFMWVQENYPKLSNEEKKRIAKICNWQKSGGAPCTL